MKSRLNRISNNIISNNIINTCNNSSIHNKGFSIIMVILAIAFVGILGATILMLSMTNLQMKYTDLHAKRTFYSAEKAMDEIKAGLQNDVSNAYAKAYSESLEKYASESTNMREENFKTNFINNVASVFDYDGDRLYNSSLLTDDYLDNYVKSNSELNENFFIKVDDTGIHLQDVKVTFTDKNGIVSIIETDIIILVPPIELFSSTTNDSVKLSDYIIYENWSKQ